MYKILHIQHEKKFSLNISNICVSYISFINVSYYNLIFLPVLFIYDVMKKYIKFYLKLDLFVTLYYKDISICFLNKILIFYYIDFRIQF